MAERRRDGRIKFIALGTFVAVFLFSFLAQNFKKMDESVGAASLANFDPGYIISDYQMGNYNSMTEAEIQAFLTKKNPCSNTNYTYYQQLTAWNPGTKWHFENGHFICLSEEKFGDGEVIGTGETAAHIIWQASQDYKINPQALIVLIQKETSLITDPIPNNYDYRKATGFGCPDTAACSSDYYGFKNQVRNAAKLFSTVLNGGWTNYPLGDNYVQYNPNASCGGTVVNIRSLATSALYRYTPYQPNPSAISAGYGVGDGCGAYGNRNFYLYFEDWFGGVTASGGLTSDFKEMVVPRVIYVKEGSRYIEPSTGNVGIRKFSSFEYFTHLNYHNKDLCLSIDEGRNCYYYSDLNEIEASGYEDMATPRMLTIRNNTKSVSYEDRKFAGEFKSGSRYIFDQKVYLGEELCLIPRDSKAEGCILYRDLEELNKVTFSRMVKPRTFYINDGVKEIDTETGIEYSISETGKIFFNQVTTWFGEVCLGRDDTSQTRCVPYKDLNELYTLSYTNMVASRFLKINSGAKLYDAEVNKLTDREVEKQIVYFDKILDTNSGLCLSSSNDKIMEKGMCVKYGDLTEVENFSAMSVPRTLSVNSGATYYDLELDRENESINQGGNYYFVDKMIVGGELCLRTSSDKNNRLYRCIKYSGLNEI